MMADATDIAVMHYRAALFVNLEKRSLITKMDRLALLVAVNWSKGFNG